MKKTKEKCENILSGIIYFNGSRVLKLNQEAARFVYDFTCSIDHLPDTVNFNDQTIFLKNALYINYELKEK